MKYSFSLNHILNSSLSFKSFNIRSSILTIVGSYLILLFTYSLDFSTGESELFDKSDEEINLSLLDYFGYIFIAPIVESSLILFAASLLGKFRKDHFSICMSIALAFATLHFLFDPMSSLGILWSFFIFTHCYLIWSNESLGRAFVSALIPHISLNIVSICVLFISQHFQALKI